MLSAVYEYAHTVDVFVWTMDGIVSSRPPAYCFTRQCSATEMNAAFCHFNNVVLTIYKHVQISVIKTCHCRYYSNRSAPILDIIVFRLVG